MSKEIVDGVWHCKTCKAEGRLEVMADGPYDVWQGMVIAHHEVSPNCPQRDLEGDFEDKWSKG